MSRARHKAAGGRTGDKSSQTCDSNFADGGEVYTGAGSNVIKEAMEKKRGGAVKGKYAKGGSAKGKKDAYKRGGRVATGSGGSALAEGPRTGSLEAGAEARKRGGRVRKEVDRMAEGRMMKRMDKRPRKARGGGVSGKVGSDKTPFSTAARPVQNTETSKV